MFGPLTGPLGSKHYDFTVSAQPSSERNRFARCISLGMMVTRLVWVAHKLESSKSPPMYVSFTCFLQCHERGRLETAVGLKLFVISRITRWKGIFPMRSSEVFWQRRISRRATVPGRYRSGFLIPLVAGASFLTATAGNRCTGTFPPVDFRALFLTRGISDESDWPGCLFGFRAEGNDVLL